MKKPVVLCILDGLAHSNQHHGNAYYLANTPTLDYLKQTYPMTYLQASGLAVGLPEGQMGNSEVGHLNIGAGRVVYQSLTRIDKAIEDKSFFQNKVLNEAFEKAKSSNNKIHIMGLVSNGGVHSQLSHLLALLEMAKQSDIKHVYIHVFLDGRDVAFDAGLKDVESLLKHKAVGEIASISGRYYAMDRDQRFERNQLCLDALVNHVGPSFNDPLAYIQENYEKQVFDEFVIPAYNAKLNGQIEADDVVISFNFRPDRMIQLGSILTNENYIYPLKPKHLPLHFVSMMPYANSVIGPVAYEKTPVINPFGTYISNLGLSQLRIAETEKYAHVTFFFDGQMKYDGQENPELPNCKRILIPSPKVATYDLKPEMSAYELTDRLIEQLNEATLDVVIVNYANCDMVGHTGVLNAAIKAVETVDTCLKRVYDKVNELQGVLLVTSDHGNSEMMLDEHNVIVTSHTCNPVELIITQKGLHLDEGKLSDIAPTMCDLLGVKPALEMTGHSLIIK